MWIIDGHGRLAVARSVRRRLGGDVDAVVIRGHVRTDLERIAELAGGDVEVTRSADDAFPYEILLDWTAYRDWLVRQAEKLRQDPLTDRCRSFLPHARGWRARATSQAAQALTILQREEAPATSIRELDRISRVQPSRDFRVDRYGLEDNVIEPGDLVEITPSHLELRPPRRTLVHVSRVRQTSEGVVLHGKWVSREPGEHAGTTRVTEGFRSGVLPVGPRVRVISGGAAWIFQGEHTDLVSKAASDVLRRRAGIEVLREAIGRAIYPLFHEFPYRPSRTVEEAYRNAERRYVPDQPTLTEHLMHLDYARTMKARDPSYNRFVPDEATMKGLRALERRTDHDLETTEYLIGSATRSPLMKVDL